MAKTGDDICISLKKRTFAIPVPITPNIKINKTERCTFTKCITSKKPVKNKIKKAGKKRTVKFPVVILKGLKSDRNLLMRFTFIA